MIENEVEMNIIQQSLALEPPLESSSWTTANGVGLKTPSLEPSSSSVDLIGVFGI
jgi:hypothetical protein